MVKLNEEQFGMDERQSAICAILEAQALAIDASLATGNEQTIPNHLRAIRRFIGEANKYRIGTEVTQKYQSILTEWGAD